MNAALETAPHAPPEYQRLVEESVVDGARFVRAVFSGWRRGHTVPWQKVVLRPVDIKGGRHIQFTYYDAAKSIDKNHAGTSLRSELTSLLRLPFRSIYVELTDRDVQITFSRRGEVSVHSTKKAAPVPLLVTHDRQKRLPLPPGKPDEYLEAVGIMAADGRIKPDKHDKFRQVNEFLKLLSQILPEQDEKKQDEKKQDDKFLPHSIVDFGCGNAYLTFATYHYFHDVRRHPIEMCGVDTSAHLLEPHRTKAAHLGWNALSFTAATIAEYDPPRAPDLVLSLHACDTATDDAIARAIHWESRYLLSVPCCHHDLQQLLRTRDDATPLKPVYRYGVLAERMGDVLTDTMRALILRICGYRCEVVQFVSTEHTAKNLMIRAARAGRIADPAVIEEYLRLRDFLGVTPYLERLLGDDFQRTLTATHPSRKGHALTEPGGSRAAPQ
ncbi:MAG: SAM-dependent methyltransferase [Chloroflexota bacterium]|nr:SAM-dependent methyltransferase [Chloroflexota bacterium]